MWQRYWAHDLMLKAVKSGDLQVDYYAIWVQEWHQNNQELALPKYTNDLLYKLNGEVYIRSSIPEESTKARAALYLDSLEEMKIKERYEVDHPEYSFSHNSPLVFELDEASVQHVIERLKLERLWYEEAIFYTPLSSSRKNNFAFSHLLTSLSTICGRLYPPKGWASCPWGSGPLSQRRSTSF